MLILLDSGSAGTFISTKLTQSLQHQPCGIMQFATADGTPMVSDSMVPQLQWCVQGHSFTYDTRVIPLKSYDMILGDD